MRIFLLSLLVFLVNCSDSHSSESPPYQPLSWEQSNGNVRKQWSNFVFTEIEDRLPTLKQVTDMDFFCPNYYSLPEWQQINVWGELFSDVAYFESAWDPTNRFKEPGMGKDPITGQPVYSEGLLQLSYQDIRWQTDCQFDWSHDKGLPPTDPQKTIFDPYINLDCGVKIMARQIDIHKAVMVSQDLYWSTLKPGSAKVKQIAQRVLNNLDFCRK